MYLDGREIDRRRGGPTDAKTLEGNVKAMNAWIDTNLFGKPYVKKNENKKVVFNGKYEPSIEPFSLP